MMSNRVIARFVGNWGLPYLYSRIGESSPFLQHILMHVDLTKGYMFVYAPRETPIEQLQRLGMGGIISGNWLSSNLMEFSEIPRIMLRNYLWRWLRSKKELASPHRPLVSRLLLAEKPLWFPGDPPPHEPPHFLLHMDTQYAWACAQDNAHWIQSLIEEVDLSYPPLLLCGIVGCASLSIDSYITSILKSGCETEYAVRLIVCGAYDGESFLVWRIRDQAD